MARYATVRTADGTRAARVDGETATLLAEADVGALLGTGSGWRERAAAADGEEIAVDGLDLAPVLPAPAKIVCVGLNYRDHAAEGGRDLPDHPQLFAKYALALTGPHDEIELPGVSEKVDWEAELGVVIGAPARRVSEADAPAHIAGYTVANDVSARDWQRRTTQYLQGKTFERTTPVGPWLVDADEIADPTRLAVRCEVDGDVVQEFSTAEMIFTPAVLVSYISQILTLEPGDLIITGTGAGVGIWHDPPRFLAPGAVLRTSIEGIGTLENRCVADDRAEAPA
jgi:acylpyruvate hydrolase